MPSKLLLLTAKGVEGVLPQETQLKHLSKAKSMQPGQRGACVRIVQIEKPEGSKGPNDRGLGPKYNQYYSIWAKNSFLFGSLDP